MFVLSLTAARGAVRKDGVAALHRPHCKIRVRIRSDELQSSVSALLGLNSSLSVESCPCTILGLAHKAGKLGCTEAEAQLFH